MLETLEVETMHQIGGAGYCGAWVGGNYVVSNVSNVISPIYSVTKLASLVCGSTALHH